MPSIKELVQAICNADETAVRAYFAALKAATSGKGQGSSDNA